ncbi:hypothetical protein Tco_1405199 [Tanacetum coccineum]
MENGLAIHMLTEKKYPLSQEMISKMLKKKLEVDHESSQAFELLRHGINTRHQEAQEDRAAVRAKIEILRRERLAYKQESIETRQALARSEAYSRVLEARIRVLETQAYRHEWQRQDADDRAIEHVIYYIWNGSIMSCRSRVGFIFHYVRTMATVNQGMSVEEIEQIVAQRVANAIEAIAIYESINQTKQQENKVAGNASNKRKWESDHNGSSNQQHKRHKVFWAHAVGPNNKKYVGTLQEGLPGAEESKPWKPSWKYKGLRKSDSKRITVIPDKDMSHHITGYRIDKYKIGIMKQRVDLTGDEDPTDEDGDTGVSVSLGVEIFLEGKKSQESNIGDSDNTRDGGKTASRAIITWGGRIASLISESEGTIVE